MSQFFPGYMPPLGNPYQPRYQQPVQQPNFMQQTESIIRVTGIEGAKAYPVQPNCRVALFDDSRDVFYLKAADGGGYPTLTAFSFAPLREDAPPTPDYVTREEFNQLKEAFENGKQPIRKAKQPDSAAE